MRQRLHVARGLLHDPAIVFLDEPTIGVDPVGARELRATISSLTASGKTVLLTTHYMFEADALCDRIAVIAQGQIVAQGTPAELKARVADASVLEVELYGVEPEAVERVRRLAGVRTATLEERDQKQLLVVQAEPGRELAQLVLAQLRGDSVGRVTSREPTLEDAYVTLVTAR
jgi:ABC-2 type transport system ATP-binding protein